jgi:hypothetical protein
MKSRGRVACPKSGAVMDTIVPGQAVDELAAVSGRVRTKRSSIAPGRVPPRLAKVSSRDAVDELVRFVRRG